MNRLAQSNFRHDCNPHVRFLHYVLAALIVAAFFVLSNAPASAQTGVAGAMLFGDLTVDESRVEGTKPLSYDVILYSLDGRVVSRQKVANGGRYRFFGVRVGEYDIVIEVDNQEVARIRINVGATGSSPEVRKDIELEWKANATVRGAPSRKSTVDVADFYTRSAATKASFEKAQSALDKKDYEQAATLLKTIVEADGKDFQAWTELGTAYLLLNKHSDAEKAYTRAIEEKPTFFLALLNLGRLRAARKNFEAAIDPLTRAVEVQPASAEANLLLGEAYLQIKKGSKAVPYLNEAAKLGRPEAHLRLATLYDAANVKDRAAAEYEQFLQKRPDYSDRKRLEKYISANKKP